MSRSADEVSIEAGNGGIFMLARSQMEQRKYIDNEFD
jgi:hypothetical protein